MGVNEREPMDREHTERLMRGHILYLEARLEKERQARIKAKAALSRIQNVAAKLDRIAEEGKK